MLRFLVLSLLLSSLAIIPATAVSCQVGGVVACTMHCKALQCAGGRCVGPFDNAICTCYRCGVGR